MSYYQIYRIWDIKFLIQQNKNSSVPICVEIGQFIAIFQNFDFGKFLEKLSSTHVYKNRPIYCFSKFRPPYTLNSIFILPFLN